MSLLLTMCLSVPGICQNNHVDQLEALALSEVESADPVERWRPLVSSVFPAAEVETALCIVRLESGGNPEADNPRSTARGLFQVLGSMWASHYGVSQTDLYDPVTNVNIAGDIWENYGWSAWSPFQRGSCRSG